MKREIDKGINYESNTVFEGYNAKISESDMNKLWDLLQDPYKNSIGAVVREYVSNSFDSHAEADFIKNNDLIDIRTEYPIYLESTNEELQILKTKVQEFDNDAVSVIIAKDGSGWFWATEDFGVGLSPNRVKDVFCSYLKSTKESTNNAIGAFGIGSKSGLSYTDAIFIRTRYNDVEYQYILRKGETVPRLDIVSQTPTTERNGTQIKIYIKSVKKYDWSSPEVEVSRFREECVKQLAYFDNVYFNDQVRIKNEYIIAKGKNWMHSSNGQPFSTLHMCLGKVAYPIDWDALGILSINFPAALKFEIGELDIIQTREDVKYTPKTKKAILDKLNALRDELKTKWEAENNYQTNDLIEYLSNRKCDPMLNWKLDNYEFNLNLLPLFVKGELPSWEFLPFKAINLDIKTLPTWGVFIDYNIPSYINDTGLKHASVDIANSINNKYPIYRIEGNHVTKKSKYIRQVVEKQDVLLMRRKKPSLRNYKEYLKLKNQPKSEWRTIIKTFQKEVQKCLLKHTKSYSKVDVDLEWSKSQYSKRGKLDNTLFNTYQYTNRDSYYGTWKSVKLKKNDVDGSNTLYIAGKKEDKDTLLMIAKMYSQIHSKLHVSECKYMKVLYVADSNVKYLKDIKNLITMENYKDKKLFSRICTVYHLLNNSKYSLILKAYNNSKANIAFGGINYKLQTEFKEFSNYVYNNLPNNKGDFLKNVYEYVVENDLLDKEILRKADYLANYLNDIPLINHVNWSTVTTQDLAVAIFRYNKGVPVTKLKKMNPNYYVNLNETELSWLNDKEQKLYTKCRLI